MKYRRSFDGDATKREHEISAKRKGNTKKDA